MHAVRRRYHGLDTLRGVTLISMMAYHACWDLVYIFGMDWDWYESFGAYLWQQSICWTFILLSGYCVQMGRHRLRRGLLVFCGGALVSAVTFFFMPEDLVFWGVLSLLGAAVLLTIPLEGLLQRIPARAGLAGSFLVFLLLREKSDRKVKYEESRGAREEQRKQQQAAKAARHHDKFMAKTERMAAKGERRKAK